MNPNFLFEATHDMYTSCLQLTGDIHEEVESQNRLLDRMVCELYFWLTVPNLGKTIPSSLFWVKSAVKSGQQHGHIEGYHVRNHGSIQDGNKQELLYCYYFYLHSSLEIAEHNSCYAGIWKEIKSENMCPCRVFHPLFFYSVLSH